MLARSFLTAAVLVIAGCAAAPPEPLAADHPANPHAEEAPLPPPSSTLSLEAAGLLTPGYARPAGEDHAGHDGRADRQPAPNPPKMHHRGRETTPAAGTGSPPVRDALYACPMHPDVISNQPGRCPKCGMELTRTVPGAGNPGEHP